MEQQAEKAADGLASPATVNDRAGAIVRWGLVVISLLAVAFFWCQEQPERSPWRVDIRLAQLQPLSDGRTTVAPLAVDSDIDMVRAALGGRLFADAGLSPHDISCADCHPPDNYLTLNRRRGPTLDGSIDDHNVPTLLNVGPQIAYTTSGRHKSLFDQAEAVIHSAAHMNSSWGHILQYLRSDADYMRQFIEVFGEEPNADNVLQALVAFERALITPNAAFDRYLRGDNDAIGAQQLRGYRLFSNFGCIACHQGANFGGNMFARFGIFEDAFAGRPALSRANLGRFNVTGRASDRHVFKVPALRNVARTAPYLHDGSIASLDDTVRAMARYQLGEELADSDVADIVAFLQSLNGELPEILQ